METNTLKNKLMRKFHALCYKNGISAENKKDIIGGYGVDSTRDLTEAQLIDIITKLEGKTTRDEADVHRKRVMAVIGAWLRRNGYKEGAETIKAVACRAAKAKDFNKISTAALKRVYNEFRKKNEVATEVVKIQIETEAIQSMLN